MPIYYTTSAHAAINKLFFYWEKKWHTLAFIDSGVIVSSLHHWSIILIGLYRVNVLVVWIICVHHNTQLLTCKNMHGCTKKECEGYWKSKFRMLGYRSLRALDVHVQLDMLNTSMYLTYPTYV